MVIQKECDDAIHNYLMEICLKRVWHEYLEKVLSSQLVVSLESQNHIHAQILKCVPLERYSIHLSKLKNEGDIYPRRETLSILGIKVNLRLDEIRKLSWHGLDLSRCILNFLNFGQTQLDVNRRIGATFSPAEVVQLPQRVLFF